MAWDERTEKSIDFLFGSGDTYETACSLIQPTEESLFIKYE